MMGSMVNTLPLIAIPLARGSHVIVLGILFFAEGLAGGGSMIAEMAGTTIRAAAVSGAVRARVSGLFGTAATGMIPLGPPGAALAAGLARTTNVHVAMYVATVGMALSVIWLAGPSVSTLHSPQDLEATAGS